MSIDSHTRGLTEESRAAWRTQLVDPGVPPQVYEALAKAQGERWGYELTVEDFGGYVADLAADVNLRADVHTVWRLAAEHFGRAT